MKMTFSAMLLFTVLGCMSTAAFAAELLDVKPVVVGSAVSVEISADIAMTYTYYKVPGQARAVIDIAEADPEKVEPLIVVNKGAVASISVDKAAISGIVVSRIVFNLVSESDISVSSTPDRKLLTVTFDTSTVTDNKVEPIQDPKPVPLPEPAAQTEPAAVVANPPASLPAVTSKEEDPLGLDEPVAKSAPPVPAAPAKESPVAPPPVPMVMRIPKLEPVVPVTVAPARPTTLSIKEITTGTSFIEIRTSLPATGYKTMRLTAPERLVIDIPGEKINQKPTAVSINKFGITRTRIGVSPKYIRVVIDTDKAGFPVHTITGTEDGLRINFK